MILAVNPFNVDHEKMKTRAWKTGLCQCIPRYPRICLGLYKALLYTVIIHIRRVRLYPCLVSSILFCHSAVAVLPFRSCHCHCARERNCWKRLSVAVLPLHDQNADWLSATAERHSIIEYRGYLVQLVSLVCGSRFLVTNMQKLPQC